MLCAWACANICLCKEADGCADTAVYMAKPRLVNSAGSAARRQGSQRDEVHAVLSGRE